MLPWKASTQSRASHRVPDPIGDLIILITFTRKSNLYIGRLFAVGSSGILKAKQKLGVTFNFDKQDVVDFMKFSKMTMCRASEANS